MSSLWVDGLSGAFGRERDVAIDVLRGLRGFAEGFLAWAVVRQRSMGGRCLAQDFSAAELCALVASVGSDG
jgi:hypothetical protein